MWNEGFNTQIEILDYGTSWRAICQTNPQKGEWGFEGLCQNPGTGFNAEQHISRWYIPGSRYSYRPEADPILTPLARKIQSEIDRQKQTEMIQEFQRLAAKEMVILLKMGEVNGFQLNWPVLGNYGVWSGTTEVTKRLGAYYWYDQSKKTA